MMSHRVREIVQMLLQLLFFGLELVSPARRLGGSRVYVMVPLQSAGTLEHLDFHLRPASAKYVVRTRESLGSRPLPASVSL